jgi:hypothetical protein
MQKEAEKVSSRLLLRRSEAIQGIGTKKMGM